jgi:hypothetical protein
MSVNFTVQSSNPRRPDTAMNPEAPNPSPNLPTTAKMDHETATLTFPLLLPERRPPSSLTHVSGSLTLTLLATPHVGPFFSAASFPDLDPALLWSLDCLLGIGVLVCVSVNESSAMARGALIQAGIIHSSVKPLYYSSFAGGKGGKAWRCECVVAGYVHRIMYSGSCASRPR